MSGFTSNLSNLPPGCSDADIERAQGAKPPARMTVLQTFNGSNGEATKRLYERLETLGPAGVVAMNLFRACKCSGRAKVYRGRRYKDDAYARKQWSLENLCRELAKSAAALGIEWGWKEDPEESYASWVLYVELPTGQCSFHSPTRVHEKDYPGEWDKTTHSPSRIILWTSQLLGETTDSTFAPSGAEPSTGDTVNPTHIQTTMQIQPEGKPDPDKDKDDKREDGQETDSGATESNTGGKSGD